MSFTTFDLKRYWRTLPSRPGGAAECARWCGSAKRPDQPRW